MRKERKLNRLKNYDYTALGSYFVTVCIKDKKEWFGDINNGQMTPNEYGKIVEQCWLDLPNHYDHCQLDEFIVMPDHFHGIVSIVGNGFKPFRTDESKPFRTDESKIFCIDMNRFNKRDGRY